MSTDCEQPLPAVRIGEIPLEENPQRWLVEQLWGEAAVGMIGGAPKCAKTWLGLDLALSVATGTACLGQYAVPRYAGNRKNGTNVIYTEKQGVFGRIPDGADLMAVRSQFGTNKHCRFRNPTGAKS